jgi:ATP-dependent Clp protease ATP-binding subunit ClpA
MFERFTAKARLVVARAEEEARSFGHPYIGTEHLLLAQLHQDCMAHGILTDAGLTYDDVRAAVGRITGPGNLGPDDAEALSTIGIDLDAVRAKMEETFGEGALGAQVSGGRPRFTRRAKKVIELSLREAINLKHSYLGTEHLLLGIIREGEGLAAKVIVDSGVTLPDLRSATMNAIQRAAA